MKPRTIRSLGLDKARGRAPSPANLASRLRRIRAELSLMMAAVDDGLQRIEAGADFEEQRTPVSSDKNSDRGKPHGRSGEAQSHQER